MTETTTTSGRDGRPIRIANVSGFYGDRFSAMSEMVSDGVDVITGDYLAELTMLILAKQRAKDATRGYASTFLDQMRENLEAITAKGIKVVTNAGGTNPAELASQLRKVADDLGVEVTIAHVEGDDLVHRAGELGWGRPVTANAYLGAWGIVACLERGADVVVTGRVTDASLVVGPAAWHFGWGPDDLDRLAGAVAAGHVIECGTQTTGGNFAFFHELNTGPQPFGFPLAEIEADGSCVITKLKGTGGAVTEETVTAQLLYEIAGARYAGPDVTARFDTVRLQQVGPDRVRLTGTVGEPPPPTLKVGISAIGGYRNEVTFVLTGLALEAKADLTKAQFAAALPELDLEWSFARTDHPDSPSQEEASALLRCVVRSGDPTCVGRSFSKAAFELALASYPGFHLTAPPQDASSYGVFTPGYVDAAEVPHYAVLDTDERVAIAPASTTRSLTPCDEPALPDAPISSPTSPRPLGHLLGARSGDKGGSANIGLWARCDEAYVWMVHLLDVAQLKHLLPETAPLEVERHVFPNLRAINFVIHGLLGPGVAYNARHDPQAKALGEWLRSRIVPVPTHLLENGRATAR